MEKKHTKILKEINPAYFWDIDITNQEIIPTKRLIIERVFSLGTINEMISLLNFYGHEEVADVLCNITYLDPKTLNFVSVLLNKPKESFRCFIRKPLTNQPWNS